LKDERMGTSRGTAGAKAQRSVGNASEYGWRTGEVVGREGGQVIKGLGG
jgi:hypothetical protein